MQLSENDIQRAIDQATKAFPNFRGWEYQNEIDEEYFGFSLWGELILDPDAFMPRHFFITLDTYKEKWRGHLTIGKHSYLWSSADVGDADLANTEEYGTLEETIAALKAEITNLCRACSAV